MEIYSEITERWSIFQPAMFDYCRVYSAYLCSTAQPSAWLRKKIPAQARWNHKDFLKNPFGFWGIMVFHKGKSSPLEATRFR